MIGPEWRLRHSAEFSEWCHGEAEVYSSRECFARSSRRVEARFCAGFRTPGCRDHPHARTAGVRKASRHEIAGCGAPTVQRVLWGFGVGVSVGEVEPTLAIGSL